MEAKLNSPVRYRGTVATADLLPLNPDIGDMYNIESKSIYGEAGMNVAWNGVVWDTMGAPIDMSLYLTKEEAETVIQRLVTEYFEKNPVKPGATTEQAQQIEQNKTDIASLKTETSSLKEDLSTKITKFYASSQGETHLADSDNGKIMDMMLYGKSEQKQYSGKNLLNPILQTTTQNGITCTANGDGTFTLNGTATANTAFILSGDILSLFVPNKKLKMIGTPKGGSSNSYRIQMWRQLDVPGELYDYGDGVEILAPTGNYNIAIWITNKFVCNNLIFKPMIVDASLYPDATYDDFEPYTGGIPSPNPDYPQEIKSVVNPTVKVCGKNLLKGKSEIKNKNVTFDVDKVIVDGEISSLYGDVFGRVFLKAGTYTVSTTFNSIQRIELRYGSQSAWVIDGKASTITLSEDIDVEVTVIIKIGIYSNVTDYIQIEKGSTATAYEPYHEQTVTLPYTLNAIPVNSGGNVTIDGQQYIADYVDAERGKLVRHIKEKSDTISIAVTGSVGGLGSYDYDIPFIKNVICNITNIVYEDVNKGWASKQACISGSNAGELRVYLPVGNHNVKIIYELETQEEIDLTPEEIAAFKALATYYPTTNISVNSEQLDGYTVFNYPISMENGWNYVKQQIGDTRDYIYDMDLQSAEAYVNSEYAIALTELEV
jgi:hypothetical protein